MGALPPQPRSDPGARPAAPQCRAGGSEKQRLLQTPAWVVLLVPCLLRDAPAVGVCVVCSVFWKLFIQTSFNSLGKEQIG